MDDHADRLPADWIRHGGVFLPMYQAEALWLYLNANYPMAVMVAAGKIDALTGESFQNELREPQNYIVLPEQDELDGFCVQEGPPHDGQARRKARGRVRLIRQFVAMPLGEGYTAEEQLTGKAEHGGLQFVVYPMKASHFKKLGLQTAWLIKKYSRPRATCASMGLAPGGPMKQTIYNDRYGLDAWDTSVRSRCFVHILNSASYLDVTGSRPPYKPWTAADYDRVGLPWFEYYDADRKALDGAPRLAGLDSVAARQVKEGPEPPDL